MSDVVTVVDAARAALAAEQEGPAVAVVARVQPDGNVRRMLCGAAGVLRGSLGDVALELLALAHAQRLLEAPQEEPFVEALEDGSTLYVEAHHPRAHLIVVGAGHIAVPVAALGHALGFRVTVLDDREEFATAERFAEDVVVLRADFDRDPFAGVTIDELSYIALLTRGHKWDFDCLRRVLDAAVQPRYIGMIGSRRRVRAAFHALLEAGTSRTALARIHAPIGIEIRAETPEEIAVSIAAELIAVRRSADIDTISRRERVLERLFPDSSKEEEANA
jgi:xanthine dehydrogenase accessory factor